MGKVRCKNAARNRRSDENEALKRLSDMLPLDTCKKSLDKAAVVRLTAAYMQLKEFSEGFEREESSDEHKGGCSLEKLGAHLLQCLDGFLLVVGLNGKTIYVSETVTDHLGLSQIEMTGDLIYGYMHPEDKSELESFLVSSVDQPSQHRIENNTKLPVKFTFRMKCTLSRRHCGFVVGGYKIIHCNGYLKFGMDVSSQNGSVVGGNRTRRRPGSGLILICQSLPWSVGTAIRLFSHMFIFRLGLDFTISNADSEVFPLTGYEPSHLHGKKLYSFLHPLHLFQIQSHHTIVLNKGQVITPYYAFLTNGGGWIWLQSYLVRMKCGKPSRDCIAACNYVLSKRQHVNLVIAEEQSCMFNSCCKVSKYNKRIISSSNRVISKRSNNIFKCCFTSAVGSQNDNTFTSGKVALFSKEADIGNRTKQNQSCASSNLSESNHQDSVQSSHLTIPLSNTNTEEQFHEQFRDRTICYPIYKWDNHQRLQMPKMNSLQKISQISKTCDPLQIFNQLHENKIFSDSNGKATNLQNCPIPSSPKEQSSFDLQKSYLDPTSLSSSRQGNNGASPLLVSKSNEDILNPVLQEEYPFFKKSKDTVKISLATKTEISQKPESILKNLLSKSPVIRYPSTSNRPRFSFENNCFLSYHKGQFLFPTYSKLNLDLPLADNKSRDLNQPKLLSPVSETALDFNCLQIQPASHCENESSKVGDVSTYIKEFPSTSTYIRSNIREIPPDFYSAQAKRIRSYYEDTKRNYSTIDSVVSTQKSQTEINNNQLHCSETENYDYLVGNTVVGCRTKLSIKAGQLDYGIETSAVGGIPEKENLIYKNDLPELKSNPFQSYENKSVCHSLVSRSTPPWNIDRYSQHQYTERKVLSLKQELDRSDFNKNAQHLSSETKVLSSSLESGKSNIDKYCQKLEAKIISSSRESDRSDINKYFQNRSLETNVLYTSLESYRSNINKYFQGQSLETKVLSSSLESCESDINKYIQDQSLEVKVLSSSLESYESDINKYIQDQSLEAKVLSSCLESCESDINKYIQDQNLEAKVLSSSLESCESNINKYIQDQSLEVKVLSSSLESCESDTINHFQNQSLETKVLSSSGELDRTKIKRNLHSSERKVLSPGFESTMSSHCSDYNYSPISFLNDFHNNDFSDITIPNVDSIPESLYSSITFENTSQLVSDLSNALTSTLQPNTSSQSLLEEILHS